jgi:hypothetical protein
MRHLGTAASVGGTKTHGLISALALSAVLLGCSETEDPDTTASGTTEATSGATEASSDTTGTTTGITETGTTAPESTGEQTTTSTSTEASTGEESGTSTGGSTGTVGEFFPDGLECTSISLCSTYDADPSAPPFPVAPGGILQDGLYRAVQGSSEPYGLAIAGDRYALIFEGLTTSFGELSIVGSTMTQTQTSVCSSNGVVSIPPQEFEFAFWTDGVELFTYSGCDSLNPDVCGSGTRLVRVDSLCEDLGSLGCSGADCECHTFTDDIPAVPSDCAF